MSREAHGKRQRHRRTTPQDVLVHTWDLARAVGGDDRLDSDLCERYARRASPLVGAPNRHTRSGWSLAAGALDWMIPCGCERRRGGDAAGNSQRDSAMRLTGTSVPPSTTTSDGTRCCACLGRDLTPATRVVRCGCTQSTGHRPASGKVRADGLALVAVSRRPHSWGKLCRGPHAGSLYTSPVPAGSSARLPAVPWRPRPPRRRPASSAPHHTRATDRP
jgi:hypothetical protein